MASVVDPDYECVKVGSAAHSKHPAEPPPGGGKGTHPAGGEGLPALCPEGYVPRRKRRRYILNGKRVRREGPAERNPDGDPEPRPERPSGDE